MSTPQVHEFGVAKYVYAAAYDKMEAERDDLREAHESESRRSSAMNNQRELLHYECVTLSNEHASTLETLREVTDALETLATSWAMDMTEKGINETAAIIAKARAAQEPKEARNEHRTT